MRRPAFAATLFATLMLAAFVQAQPATAPAAGAARGRGQRAGGPPQSATQPAIKNPERHAQFLEIAKAGDIDLLFIGDSITDFWASQNPNRGGRAVWDKYFAPLKAANFGINADRTQHVLWRLQNGELEGFKAKCIVLMLGTNNITVPNAAPRNTNEETIAGMTLVINEIRQRQPQARLLLLAIFPRGQAADNPYREPIKQVNAALAKFHDGRNIFFLDIGDKFLAADGSLPAEIMPDFLHPGEKGYQIWADAIIGKVKELMAAN